MKKLMPFIAISLLAACGTAEEVDSTNKTATEEAPDMPQLDLIPLEGYVTKVEEPGRYVIAHHEPKNVSPGNEQFVDVLLVRSEEQLEVGDYVKAWYDIVLTSYPGQTTAKKLEVVEPTVKSNVTAKEVVAAVAAQLDYYPIITNVAYDEVKKRWTLQYKELNRLGNDHLVSMAIDDKAPLTLGEPIYDMPPSVQLKLNDTDFVDFTLQSYDWTYVDLATDREQHVQETVEGVDFLPVSEGYTVSKPAQLNWQSQLPIESVDMQFLDAQQNVVATVKDAADIPAGVHAIQLNVTFAQGTATYVQTIGFE